MALEGVLVIVNMRFIVRSIGGGLWAILSGATGKAARKKQGEIHQANQGVRQLFLPH